MYLLRVLPGNLLFRALVLKFLGKDELLGGSVLRDDR